MVAIEMIAVRDIGYRLYVMNVQGDSKVSYRTKEDVAEIIWSTTHEYNFYRSHLFRITTCLRRCHFNYCDCRFYTI